MKKGFDFTLMVAGTWVGLGGATLLVPFGAMDRCMATVSWHHPGEGSKKLATSFLALNRLKFKAVQEKEKE